MDMDIRPHFISAQFTGRALLEDGSLAYFENGLIHRDGKPAREFPDGTTMYYAYGMLHNDDGPAVQRPDGSTEYWHRGRPCHARGSGSVKADGPRYRVTMLASKPEI